MSNVTEIRPSNGEPASKDPAEHPLAIAAKELLMARSCLDVLHEVYAIGDDMLKESVISGLPGMLYDILCRVERAEECVNSLPHV